MASCIRCIDAGIAACISAIALPDIGIGTDATPASERPFMPLIPDMPLIPVIPDIPVMLSLIMSAACDGPRGCVASTGPADTARPIPRPLKTATVPTAANFANVLIVSSSPLIHPTAQHRASV